jgi:hypothetical protein
MNLHPCFLSGFIVALEFVKLVAELWQRSILG